MAEITEDFKVLNKDEQKKAYEMAKQQLEVRDIEWVFEQKKFLDENPDYRDNPALNAAFVLEVNQLIATEEGMVMTDREVLQTARELTEKESWQ